MGASRIDPTGAHPAKMEAVELEVPRVGAEVTAEGLPVSVARWDVHQRVQHFMLMISMIVLMFTGFPIKFATASWSAAIIRAFGGFGNLLAVHKAAAILLVLTGVYHLVYLVWCWVKKGKKVAWAAVRGMMPSWKDVTDAVQHGLYLIGAAREKPKYGRYSYLEKFEYLAVLWGMIVMGGSGFAIWFPDLATQYLPRWVVSTLRVVHSNEAIIALLSLTFGHLFFVHFHPEVFPTSSVWFNGRISLRRMAEEHPLEFEALGYRHAHLEVLPAETSRWSHSKPLIIIELIVFTAIFVALLVAFVPMLLS